MIPMVVQFETPVHVRDFNAALEPSRPSLAKVPGRRSPHALLSEDAWVRSLIAQHRRPNVLVQCAGVSLASAAAAVSDLCSSPLLPCTLPGKLELPVSGAGTLLIGDVAALTLQQQVELFDWIERSNQTTQVVSIASVPLWAQVERGAFLEGLFYRLNVVSVTAAPQI